MRTKVFTLFIVFAGLLLSSCSKNDESIDPIGLNNSYSKTTWVNYTHIISKYDVDIPYTIQYLSASGMQTVTNHTGNFSARVPVMQTTKNGEDYAKTGISITPFVNDGGDVTPLHSKLTISTDGGLILAQAGQTTYDCGYDERTLHEETPLAWFRYK
jgi:hypothetical protein